MTSRVLGTATVGLLALLLTACPAKPTRNDAGQIVFDAGNPEPRDACSGGCADNQICDTARRTCVSGCVGGCATGVCVKTGTTFACAPPPATTCGGSTCGPGQIACLGGQCSCLASALGTGDTCTPFGQWCGGGVCNNPRALEQCKMGGPACPTGHACTVVFGEEMPICTKTCTVSAQCNVAEICFSVGCLPSAFASGQECSQFGFLSDGGLDLQVDGGMRRLTVPVSNTCLLKDDNGNIGDMGKGLGNCTYSFVKFVDDGIFPVSTCRAPGLANEGQACRTDYSRNAKATQCNTGLQCITTKGGDEGVCLRMCNANPPKFGITPTPACDADETCVNQFRYTDPSDNAVLGVCMKSCNVFDPVKSVCAKVGTTNTSCVPTSGNGSLLVTTDGAGLCVPQQATVAAVGASCNEIDPFRGAACGSAQVCTSRTLDTHASCVSVCDLSCSPSDGGTGPARCEAEPNARCAAGKTCKRITSTTGAVVGFCE